MSDDIRVFKTLSGEDIISEVSKVEETHYVLKNPSVLVLQETESGVRVGLAPFMPYAKGSIALYASSVMAEAAPDDSMVDEYKRIFSPIVVPQSSIITAR